jgi:hypothetical protein
MADIIEARKCPVCGIGDFVDVGFREGAAGAGDEVNQTADTSQVETYSCGHEVVGPRLDRTAAGTDDLDVEHRTSEETVDPL